MPNYYRQLLARIAMLLNLLTLGISAFCADPALELATNRRMQKIMATAAVQLDRPFVMLGSWVSGKKYADPLGGGTSDHDLRLLLPKKKLADGTLVELTRQEALGEWKKARATINTLVRKEFGKDADAVLKTINVYPPAQLMRNVNDAEEAYVTFQKLGVVPALSQAGPPGGPVNEKVAEGLYGKGSGVWTQDYERKAGKVVYPVVTGTDPATKKPVVKAFTGVTDLTHLEEGSARYTAGGMGNTSLQWVGHAEEAIAGGDGKKVVKYLTRLEGDLAKGRDLIGMGPSGPWRNEIHTLMKTLERDPSKLTAVKEELAAVLGRARLQSAILAKMGDGTTIRNGILSSMLKSVEDGRDLSRALATAAGKVPLEKILDGLMLYMAALETSRAAGEKDPAAGLVAVAAYLNPLGAGLLTQLTGEVLAAAKDGGYDLVAGRQQAFDLLDGIYSAGGRENVEGRQYSLDQLVRQYKEGDEEKLRSFVYGLCQEASKRNLGAVTGQADAGVANAMLARVYPVILRAWRVKREELAQRCIALREQYLAKGLQLSYTPAVALRDPATGAVSVTVTPAPLVGKYDNELSGMRAVLTTLYGPGTYFINITDTWSPEGKPAQNGISRIFKYTSDDRYAVTVTRTMHIGGTGIPANSPLLINCMMEAAVDIRVGNSPLITFENLPEARGFTRGLTVTPAALVEGIPAGITKLAYRWFYEYDEYDEEEARMSPVLFYPGSPSDTIRITARPHAYPDAGWKTVRLQLFDASKPTFNAKKDTPLAVQRRPIVVTDVTIPGPWEVGFTLDSGFTENDVRYPYANVDTWDSPKIGISGDVDVTATGDFTFTLEKKGDFPRAFRCIVTGVGKIENGVASISGTWTRSRDFKTFPWIDNKIARITQTDTGTFLVTGSVGLDKYGSMKCTATRTTGTFDTKQTIAWLKDDGTVEKTETFAGTGQLAQSSTWRMNPKK